MIRAPLSTTSVLDESADAVRVTGAAWAALLILTSLPYRFAQAIFIDRLLEQPPDVWHAWAKSLAAAIADEDATRPVSFRPASSTR